VRSVFNPEIRDKPVQAAPLLRHALNFPWLCATKAETPPCLTGSRHHPSANTHKHEEMEEEKRTTHQAQVQSRARAQMKSTWIRFEKLLCCDITKMRRSQADKEVYNSMLTGTHCSKI